MTKPPSSINCPHCFARLDVLPGPPAASPTKWLLVLLVVVAAFCAGRFITIPHTSSSANGLTKNPDEPPLTSAPSKPKRPQPQTWDEFLLRAQRDNGDTPPPAVLRGAGMSYEKGKPYFLDANVAQFSNDMTLARSPFGNHAVYAVLLSEKGGFDDVSLEKDDNCEVIGLFGGYREFDMVSGAAERFPVFVIVGLRNNSRSYFRTFD